ncbi:sugar ABC transporter ATP-binding protein [Fodinicurvata sp. EGI_FJ10296]|uniref:sugar ABC transporter ATP-binding protein n=1 Tax=Fodinicurvata sp. EGI_FJ10296 TaxID=3231908 RepID=UPI003453F89D
MALNAGRAAVTLRGISKRYGENHALMDVDLDVRGGEVVVLLGANGAGKSTLVRILSGAEHPDSGEVAIGGETVLFQSPADARRQGIQTVHQGINDGVVPEMTVAENLMLDALCAPAGGNGGSRVLASRRMLRDGARRLQETLGLDLPLDAPASALGQADRQLIAIARAIGRNPRLLILDEPTSSLSDSEAGRLFDIVETLRDQGVAIIYISHRMADIRRLADRILVLRDGRSVGLFETKPLDTDAALTAMLGVAMEDIEHAVRPAGRHLVEMSGVRLTATAPSFDLALAENEVVCLTGLIGAGKTELAETIFGLRRPAAGRIEIDGRNWAPASPWDAIAGGVFMIPEDRANNSLFPDATVERNITFPFLDRYSRAGVVMPRREREAALAQIDGIGIKCSGPDAPILSLSGGNQQKVVVGRWLSQPCRLIILDEPFQGVDIAARRDIARGLRETAGDRATLVLCTDLDEALEVADRIVVMRDFGIVADYRVDRVDRETMVADIVGARRRAAAT